MSDTTEPPTESQPIVVGFVPTAQGHAAVDAAVVHAQRWETGVVVVNSAHGAYMDSQLATRSDLEQVRRQVEAAGVSVEIHQLAGSQDPVSAVIDLVEQVDARMLVIGLRRRSPVGKFLMGSTAQSLLQHSPVPVLAVKSTS